MAHALDTTTGRAALAFTGKREHIWHGLGQTIDSAASIEEWQTAAALDWTVERSKIRYATERGQDDDSLRVIDDKLVLFRSDTGAALGVVSDTYKRVQPREVLEFFRDLIDAAGFKLTTAGSLHGGKKIWAQADVGAVDSIVPRDFVGARLLLATSYDGSLPTVAKGVSERVVCANTLGFAMSERGGSIVKVNHRSHFNPDLVKRQLGVAVTQFAKFITECRELAKREVSPAEASAFVAGLFGATPESKPEAVKEIAETFGYRSVMALFDGAGRGATLPGVKGTAWGLLNAATEYVDHFQRSRTQDNKFDSAMFGAGDELKNEAHDAAVALLA
jgi:phage/plasmid-like protein (TIGR03299 family)